jgi:hypothetical protein
MSSAACVDPWLDRDNALHDPCERPAKHEPVR